MKQETYIQKWKPISNQEGYTKEFEDYWRKRTDARYKGKLISLFVERYGDDILDTALLSLANIMKTPLEKVQTFFENVEKKLSNETKKKISIPRTEDIPVVPVVTEMVPVAAPITVMAPVVSEPVAAPVTEMIPVPPKFENVEIPNNENNPYMCYAISAMCFLLTIDSYRETFLPYKDIRKKPGEMNAFDYIHELVKMSKTPSENDDPLSKLQEIRKRFWNASNRILFKAGDYSVCIIII